MVLNGHVKQCKKCDFYLGSEGGGGGGGGGGCFFFFGFNKKKY
jgi:hypothetical protein